jgi:hypothetical protein
MTWPGLFFMPCSSGPFSPPVAIASAFPSTKYETMFLSAPISTKFTSAIGIPTWAKRLTKKP